MRWLTDSLSAVSYTHLDVYKRQIPSRGTWLEYMTETKKASTGRVLNMSIDRKRKMLSSVLFKAVGMSIDLDHSEDAHDTTQIKTFLKACLLYTSQIQLLNRRNWLRSSEKMLMKNIMLMY